MSSDSVPKYVQEALSDPMWKEAINEEVKALYKNETLDIVDLSKDKKLVGCKWVFTIKYKVDGSIEKYKERNTYKSMELITKKILHLWKKWIPLEFFYP